MSKRVIAALLAMMMCAGAVSCGKNDLKATEQTSGNETAETDKGTGISIDTDNIIIDNSVAQSEVDMSKEDIAQFLELCAHQYDAVVRNDNSEILRTLNLKPVAEPSADAIRDIILNDDIGDSDMAKYRALYTTGMLMLENDMPGADTYELDKDEDGSKFRTMMKNYATSLTAEDIESKGIAEYLCSSGDEELAPIGKLDSNTVCGIQPDTYLREGNDIYMNCDICIYNGDHAYTLNEVILWRVGDECGVVVGSVFNEDNPYKGMNAKEIQEYEKKQESEA